MLFNKVLHVRHTAITEFKGIFVKDFVVYMSSFKMFFNNFEELLANICFGVHAVGWVKPNNFSVPVASFCLSVVVRHFVFKTTSGECSFILVFSIIKRCLVTRCFTDSCCDHFGNCT